MGNECYMQRLLVGIECYRQRLLVGNECNMQRLLENQSLACEANGESLDLQAGRDMIKRVI